MTDLSDSKTLILGGSGVLGTHIAAALRARGGHVVLAGRDTARLQQVATDLGGDVRSVEFDLRQPHHASHVVESAVTMLGGLDGVVNAAGVVAFGPLAGMDDATLEELVATDLLGPLRVMREATRT